MNQNVLFFVVVSALCIARSIQYKCSSCAVVFCPAINPYNCKFGVGKDRCGCCSVCLNGPGTPCAGPNNIEGNCGKGLVCIDNKLNIIPPYRGPNTPIGECDNLPGPNTNKPCGGPSNIKGSCRYGFVCVGIDGKVIKTGPGKYSPIGHCVKLIILPH